MGLYGFFILSAVALVVNMWCFWGSKTGKELRWFHLTWAALAALAIILLGDIAISNIAAGCMPWAPTEVEFHQGMTICPGQTAKGFMIMPDVDLIHSPLHQETPRI